MNRKVKRTKANVGTMINMFGDEGKRAKVFGIWETC